MRATGRLLLGAAALAAAVVVFASTELDLVVQDALYDFAGHRWSVDAHAPLPRLLFYRLPKLAFASWAVALGARALVARRRTPRGTPSPVARESLYLLATLATVPLLAGLGKTVTGVHCPSEVDRYGGRVPHHFLFEALFEPRPPAPGNLPRGRCFPAAHASGGFALMALAFVGSRRLRRAGWGLALGWVLGAYQMARGAHYLSHTVAAMLLAWGIALALARAFGLDPRSAQPEGAGHNEPGLRRSSGS